MTQPGESDFYIEEEINFDSPYDSESCGTADIPIRKRTFNPDLKDLVSRIITNEDKSSPEEDAGQETALDRSGLLFVMHKLFYRIKNITGDNIDRSFDLNSYAASQKKDFSPDALLYQLFDAQKKPQGVRRAAAMRFVPGAKAYLPYAAYPDSIVSGSLIIGLKDPLLQKILNSPAGVEITSQEAADNPFLSKTLDAFIPEGGRMFFLSMRFITSGLCAEAGLCGHENIPFVLAPIFAILVDNDLSSDEIIRYIQAAKIYSALLSHSAFIDNEETCLDYETIEVLHSIAVLNGYTSFFMVKNLNNTANDFYLLKYIEFKLRLSFKGKIAVSRIGFNRFMIFGAPTIEGSIHRILAGIDSNISIDEHPLDRSIPFRDFYYKYFVE